MTTTGIIETDELISEARDQANREIGRLKAQNERLTAELKRALAKIDSLEPTDQEEGTDLLDSFWDGRSETFAGEKRESIYVDYHDESLVLTFDRPQITVKKVPY